MISVFYLFMLTIYVFIYFFFYNPHFQIDLDTIDVSNLNRQFLFQKKHVGKSKAQVNGKTDFNLCVIQKYPPDIDDLVCFRLPRRACFGFAHLRTSLPTMTAS